jgi:hypothetical protein
MLMIIKKIPFQRKKGVRVKENGGYKRKELNF